MCTGKATQVQCTQLHDLCKLCIQHVNTLLAKLHSVASLSKPVYSGFCICLDMQVQLYSAFFHLGCGSLEHNNKTALVADS